MKVYKKILSVLLCAYTFTTIYPQELISLARAAKENPQDVVAQFNVANEYFRSGEYPQAIIYYQKAIALQPHLPEPHFNLGVVYVAVNNTEKAIEEFKNSIHYRPYYPKAHAHLARQLYKKEQFEQAEFSLQKAIEQGEISAEIYTLLARAQLEQSKFEASLASYQKALAIHPHEINALLGLGNAFNMLERTDEALATYHKLLPLTDESASVLYNIAYTLKKQGKIGQALGYYEKTLAKDPHHTDANFGLGLFYLSLGDFERGWPLYEYRWGADATCNRMLKQPTWDGVSSLQGKTILLHAEQGLGDTLQFIRYAHVLKEKGARVIFAAQAPLVTLLTACCPFLNKVVHLSELYKTPCDVQLPLMSLPLLLKTTVETIPHEIPYIFPDKHLVEHWKNILAHDKKFKVGLCWQGNANYRTHFLRVTVAAKSFDVSTFAPLAQCPNVSFYSLQKIAGTEQLEKLPSHFVIHDFGNQLDEEHGRFMDTTAIMKNLDLIITVDTGTAHLAGALGVPVWVLLPQPADWRWMLDRCDTPWYPNMRLFRQVTHGDWRTIMNIIKNELQKISIRKDGIVTTQVSYGELIDKMTILEIKTEQIKDPVKLRNVQTELEGIQETYVHHFASSTIVDELASALKQVNLTLWDLEDKIREKERTKVFDEEFIKTARSVYLVNDERAAIKRKINELLKSKLIEEKCYTKYK